MNDEALKEDSLIEGVKESLPEVNLDVNLGTASHLPQPNESEVKIEGFFLLNLDNYVQVAAFLMNGLPRPVRFEQIPLKLTDRSGQVLLGYQVFDMSNVPEIPANGVLPIEFNFSQDNIFTEKIFQDDWKLSFEMENLTARISTPQPVQAMVIEGLNIGEISEDQRQLLEGFLVRLPQIKEGELNFAAVQCSFQDGALEALLLIRNGTARDVHFAQLPLALRDAQSQEVAQAVFTPENLVIRARSARFHRFVFGPEHLLGASPDLSRWSVYVPQSLVNTEEPREANGEI
ncbi:SLAP domain-containing protein [Heliobacterium mobile]|nr:SLAP domain-containing protein [Heliobacterium mobile]